MMPEDSKCQSFDKFFPSLLFPDVLPLPTNSEYGMLTRHTCRNMSNFHNGRADATLSVFFHAISPQERKHSSAGVYRAANFYHLQAPVSEVAANSPVNDPDEGDDEGLRPDELFQGRTTGVSSNVPTNGQDSDRSSPDRHIVIYRAGIDII